MKRNSIVFFCFFICTGSFAQGWKEYKDTAQQYFAKKLIDPALEYYLLAKNLLQKDSAVTFTQAEVCYYIGYAYSLKGEFESAEPFYIESNKIFEKRVGKQDFRYATSCFNLGAVNMNMGRYEKAESYFIEAKNIREKNVGRQSPTYVRSCNILGGLYIRMLLFAKASSLFMEVREILKGLNVPEEHPDYISNCNNLAYLFSQMGNYRKAEPYLLEIKQVHEKAPARNDSAYAEVCNSLGTLYIDLADYDKAEQFYLETKRIRKKNGIQNPDYAGICLNLGNLYSLLGQYKRAEQHYTEGKDIQAKLLSDQSTEYAMSCNSLAGLYRNTGEYEKSESLFLEAKKIFQRNAQAGLRSYAGVCYNLASLYRDKGLPGKAEPLNKEALQIWEKISGKLSRDYAAACNNLAATYLAMNEYKKAEPLFLEALFVYDTLSGKDHPEYATASNNVAALYWSMKEYSKARQFDEASFRSFYSNIRKVFTFSSEQEKYAYLKTLEQFNAEILSFNAMVYPGGSQDFTYDVLLANRNMILTSSQETRQYVLGKGDTALVKKYNDWIDLKKELSFWYTKPVSEREEVVKRLEENADIIEKELTRSSFLFKAIQSPVTDINWKRVQQSLKPGEATVEFASFRYYDVNRVTDSTYYIALVLRKDKPEPQLIKLFEEKELDALLKIYKGTSAGQTQLNFLYTKMDAGGKENDRNLYELLWKPLENKLAGVHTVYFAPAGSLFKISFAALPVSSNETLSDKYRLVQVNTTASVAAQPAVSITASDKVMLYGGVQYDVDSTGMKLSAILSSGNDVASRSLPDDLSRDGVPEFGYLSGTGKEIAGISRLGAQKKYNVSTAEGKNATEESFKALSGNNSPAVLHIATHGFFFPDPKNNKKDDRAGGSGVFRQSGNPLIRSGLALSGANNAWKGKPVKGVEDGILTAYEVSSMYLPNTKLAVLSACETGLGDIQGSEGVYGLQRAFKMAGVPNLVMSLWKVPDLETSEFMEQLYKGLFEKQTIGDAFYQAQSMMKNKYRNDPYRWAAWILVR